MPRPTSSTTLQRPDLAAMLMEVAAQEQRYIGSQVMPYFNVPEKSADYPIITAEALMELPDDIKRSPRSGYARSDYEFETGTYECVEHGYEELLDDVERAMYARFFDAEKVASMRALGIVMRAHEKRIADMLFNTDNFTANAVTNEWDDASNATPIDDVNEGIEAIDDLIGRTPDTLIITSKTFRDLGLCDQIVDRIKYTNSAVSRGQIPANLLAQAFGVDRVLIAGGLYNGSKKGQDASLTKMWDSEYAMLCCTNAGQDLTQPCVGRTFRWTGIGGQMVVESYREDDKKSDVYRVAEHTDECFVSTDAAYLLSNIYTTA